MWDIEVYRAQVNRLLVPMLWALAPLSAGVAYSLDGPWLLIGGAGLAAAAIATGVWRASPSREAARITISVALMGEISLLLGASAGGFWQVDVHMAYFAGVALVAVYCDAFAIAAATATVALHHLTLNYLLPEALYPGGSDLVRVLLHAGVLSVQAAGLIWMSSMLASAFARSAAAGKRADEALTAAQAAAQQAEGARGAERRETEQKQALQHRVTEEQGATASILADRLALIAEGDLTARISEELTGQYAAMKTDFNVAIGKLASTLGVVSQRASSVHSGTGRIADTAEALSSRSEQQAQHLSETVAALERISGLIKDATERAIGARAVVSSADADAKQSSEIVGKAVAAMGAITESSSRIGQITGAIDEIAFQTNLLALNAGVEAARAGESGRGFAVVAMEVRALAQRSAQAAKEIKELVSASMAQVETGAELVAGAGEALNRIASKVSEVNGVVGQIADKAKEQLAGVSEIHRCLTDMDATTQQNVTMAQEASRASRELAAESDELGQLMRQFKVGDERAAKSPKVVAIAPPRAKSAVRPTARAKVANGDWSEF